MRCPRCDFEQPSSDECSRCGIVIAKWQARQGAVRSSKEPEPEPLSRGAPVVRQGADAKAHELVLDPLRLLPRPRPSRAATRDACIGLARLLRAGVGLRESLVTVSTGARGTLKSMLTDVRDRVEAGEGLADALSHHPRLLGRSEVQLLRAAERTGDVAPALDALASTLDARIVFRRQLLRSALYPLTVLGSSVLLLPLPQLFLGSAGAYALSVLGHALVLATLAAAVVWGLPALWRWPPAGDRLREIAWRIPWPGSLYRAHVRATFCRVLGRNLEAGLPIFESVRTAAGVADDPATSSRADAAEAAIEAGGDLAAALGASGLIPGEDLLLVVTGERSGALVESLEALAATYGDRVRRGLRTLLTVVGFVLTLAVFAWVALGVLDAWRGVSGASEDLFRMIEQEMPYQLLDAPGGAGEIDPDKLLEELNRLGR